MKDHKFFTRVEAPYEYKIIFNKQKLLYVVLLAPVLFDFQQKGRYCLIGSEVNEYNAVVGAARQAEEAARNASTIYHFNHYPGQDGYQPWP